MLVGDGRGQLNEPIDRVVVGLEDLDRPLNRVEFVESPVKWRLGALRLDRARVTGCEVRTELWRVVCHARVDYQIGIIRRTQIVEQERGLDWSARFGEVQVVDWEASGWSSSVLQAERAEYESGVPVSDDIVIYTEPG